MVVDIVAVALFTALMQGVFCKTWEVTLPQSIVGISGSCATVPCSFKVPNDQEKNIRNCTNGGIWKRGSTTGPTVSTARSPHTNTKQVEIVGDLKRKNCTTIFHSFSEEHSDMYFFRLDCSETLKFTYSDGVNITTQAGQSRPVLIPVGHMSEGSQVWLQCSVPVPCSILPPSIVWLPQDNSRQEETRIQQNAERQMMMTSTLTFTASADHHNRSVTCSVSYPLTKGGSTQPSEVTHRLNVIYAPRFTVATLSRSGPVSEGRFVMFTCSSDANPPVSLYSWYRVDSGNFTRKAEGEMFVLKVSERDSGVYLCEALNTRGSQRSRPVHLEVNPTTGSSDLVCLTPCIICGVMLLICILTAVVNVYKYQSLSRRLKEIELKGEHIYVDLRTSNVASDYDRFQHQQLEMMPPPDDYENLQKSPPKVISKSS